MGVQVQCPNVAVAVILIVCMVIDDLAPSYDSIDSFPFLAGVPEMSLP